LASGKISDGLYYMVGGYIESSADFRDAEFDSGEGRQITVNITKELDNGRINFYTRDLDDSTAYELFRPVSQTLGEIPTFNASQDTFLSRDIRFHEVALNSNGDSRVYDMKDGRTTDISVTGFNAEFNFDNGLIVRNSMNYTSGSTGNAFLVPLAPLAVNTDGPLGDTFGGRAGVGGTATVISTGQVLGADDLVYGSNFWIQDAELESFSNDLSFNMNFGDHDVTLGLYLSKFENSYFQNRGTSIYHTVESNTQRVDLVQADGSRTINGQSELAPGRFGPVATGEAEGDAKAIYISDNWTVNDRLTLDFGLRHESFDIDVTRDVCNFGSCGTVQLSNGLNVPINDGVIDVRNSYDDSQLSWSVGSNWSLSDSSALFARLGEGHLMPQPQNVEGNPLNEPGQLDQIEFGYKLLTESFDLFATVYQVEFTAPTLSSVEGAILRDNSATQSRGIELDAEWRMGNFALDLIAGKIDAEFTESNDPSIIGNEPTRTPSFTFRASPSYTFNLNDDNQLVLFGALQAFGERQANTSNTGGKIPSYETIDLGASLMMGNLEFSLRAKNIADEIGLTEGTPQTSSAITPFVVVVPGRTVQFSVGYNF